MANTFVFEDDDQPQPEMGFEPEQPEEPQPEDGGEKSNRTFLIAAIVLGGIVLLSLVCMAVYALVIMPSRTQARISAESTNAANATFATATAVVDQLTQAALLFTPTSAPTDTPLPAPTSTPLLAPEDTATPIVVDTVEPGTATQEALYTQLANAQKTGTPKAGAGVPSATPGNAQTATAMAKIAATKTSQLSKTGFADEAGLPGLFGAALILIAVILLARRLRAAPLSR
jgi:hypothetical protein